MLNFSKKFGICCLLDSHNYQDKYAEYNFLFALDAVTIFSPSEDIFNKLSVFISKQNDWLFGHLNYNLENEILNFSLEKQSSIDFPPIFLFQPDIVVACKNNSVTISSINNSPKKIFDEINKESYEEVEKNFKITMQPRISKEKYLSIIQQLQKHILRGDCYEINFCQEFFAEQIFINPENIYHKLSSVSPSPFAAFYKIQDKYLLCASPERFLKKQKNKIISQPMKGTIKRNIDNEMEDLKLKNQLQNSAKDKSENVMVVDLVRNDFSKICKENSVHVEELFSVYSFPQVHQMISTVIGELEQEINFAEIVKATFPMGSMTGAPKKSVMQLIEKYETTTRNIFSGCVGYISPEKNFDFNVVIRSLMYNDNQKYLNFKVGSGITSYSNAESEYEECLLKAEAIIKTLN